MRITSKGQVPSSKIGSSGSSDPHTEVEFEIDGDAVRLKKPGSKGRRGTIVAHLRGQDVTMSTDEIMAAQHPRDSLTVLVDSNVILRCHGR